MADTLTREAIAYGSQPLSPVPQYWNGTSYEKVQGTDGAIRVINFDSAGETFTDASPGSVTVVSSAGGSAVLNSGNPGIVEIVLSAGGSAAFSKTNPAYIKTLVPLANPTVYSGTITWTSGSTATSSQTLSISATTAITTTQFHEIVATNDGSYAITLDVYKVISANGSTFTTSAITTIKIPAETVSAGVTINAVRAPIQGLFSFNTGITIRFTVTAAFTATVTNSIVLKEFL